MRLPRYSTGQSNVGMLEQGRSVLQSPQEAAAAASAPYEAITDISGIAQETIQVLDTARRERELEDAKVDFAIGEANRKGAYTGLIKDPELVEKMTEDPDYFKNEVAKINESYAASLEGIKDQRLKTQFLKEQKIKTIEFSSNVEADLGIVQNKVGKGKAITGIEANLLAGDPDEAEKILKSGSRYFNPAEEALYYEEFNRKRVDIQVQSIKEDARNLYDSGGEDAVRELIKTLQTDDEISDEVQDGAIAAVKSVLVNSISADKSAKEAYELEQAQESSKRRIEFAYGLQERGFLDQDREEQDKSINEFADTEKLSHSERAQLFGLRDRAIEEKAAEYNFVGALYSGEPLEDTKKHRELLDNQIAIETAGQEPEEAQKTITRLVNMAGFPSQRMINRLQAGVRSAPDMESNIELYIGLTSGEKRFDLGLTDKQRSDYDYVTQMVEYADTPEKRRAAIEQWDQAKRNKLTAQYDVWTEDVYDGDSGQKLIEKEFKKGIDEGRFKEGWFDPEDNFRNDLAQLELRNRFYAYAKNQLELGAMPTDAARNAWAYVEDMGGSTNINGKLEKQLNVPRGTEDIDMRHLKDKVVGVKDGFEGLHSGVTQIDGDNIKVNHYATSKEVFNVDDLDGDKVRLYVPLNRADSRDAEGNVVFEVYYDGVPLTAMTDKGTKPMRVSIPVSEFANPEATEERDIAAEIREARAELEKLKKSSGNEYDTRNVTDEIRKQENVITELQRQYFK